MAENIFGAPAELPKAVSVEDLTAPSFSREQEYINYEPVEEGQGFNLEDMLSDKIDEELRHIAEDELGDEPDLHTPPDPEIREEPEPDFGIDDLDAEMIAEVWNDFRVTVHDKLYNWAIYKHPKKAKEIYHQLALKDNKTPADKALFEQLHVYITKHDELRSDYMSAVPYSEKHQALLLRFIEYQMSRMRAKGQRFPRWIIWVYLFVVPEAKMGMKFASIRSEIPAFNFDYEQFQREQNGT